MTKEEIDQLEAGLNVRMMHVDDPAWTTGQAFGLIEYVRNLEAAIRKHRDERGDDRCHADDGELYKVLPEGDTRPARETAVTLENCAKYIECRQTGREYVSPQRRTEELEAEVTKLRKAIQKAGFAVLQASNGWSIHDVSERAKELEADDLKRANRITDLECGLKQAVERMTRARGILTNDNPTPMCNWGMLDASDLTKVLEGKT